MSKLPAKVKRIAKKALVAGKAEVPAYRILDALAEKKSDVAGVAEKFSMLNDRELRRVFHNAAEVLRALEETLEDEAAEKEEKQRKAKAPGDKKTDKKAEGLIARARNIKIFTDGACSGNPGPMGIGYAFEDMEGNVLLEEARTIGEGTNNIAEYRALIGALRRAADLGKKNVYCFSDSQLMVRQIHGDYKVKAPQIMLLIRQVQDLRRRFDVFQITYIPREQNSRADGLASGALKRSR